MHLIRNLYQHNMRNEAKLANHLDAFNKILDDMVNFYDIIRDKVKALYLIYSLMVKYEPMALAKIHGKSKLKYDKIFTTLCCEELRKISREEVPKDVNVNV